MVDPFSYFGISSNSSRTELDNAYRKMKKNYSNDKNTDSLTWDISENKLKEIDEMYWQAVELLNNNAAQSTDSVSENTSQNMNVNNNTDYNQNTQTQSGVNMNNKQNKYINFEHDYQTINNLINSKSLAAAEKILRENNLEDYAKWNYAFARLRFTQGWMNEALDYYRKAYELEPSNEFYRRSYENICNMRDGKIKKHNNKVAAAIAIGIGAVYCCCDASIIFEDTNCGHLLDEGLEGIVENTGLNACCCEPCGDGVDAYCSSICSNCGGGCRMG